MPDLKAPILLDGCKLDMYGGDREHSPRHFHIRKTDDWELIIYYRGSVVTKTLQFEIKLPTSKRKVRCPLKKNQRKRLLKLICKHLDELDKQWEELNPNKPE